MSEAGDEEPAPAGSPFVGREFMDSDPDLATALWPPFDHIAAFVSSPPPPFLPSSSPSQSLMQLSFPPSPSPLRFFEDSLAEISSSLADCPSLFHCNSDTTTASGNNERDDGRTSLLQMKATEENFNSSSLIKERMSRALRSFKESTDQNVLVQVWAPVKNGDRYVLTTSGQPFILDPQSTRLLQYRTASLSYLFPVDEDRDGVLGLPGRVFKQKLPEWTPNVQYYSSKEYARLIHALHYDVRGTLALPVFEPSGQSCVGVVELVMTSQKIHYAPDVDRVCKALEAVNLKSSEILVHPNVQICNEGRRDALTEILEILSVVCEAHKLPLAQTWVPCRHRSVMAHGGGLKKSCSSFDGSCMGQICMSTTDVAFYVVDPHMWGFRDACVEHHLLTGQGVAGRAFESRRPYFCKNVTYFSKVEYPLVHYARLFGLASCLAVCLQSTRSGDDDYILEFFLPPGCKDSSDQQVLLDSISSLMKQCFRSLKVVEGLEIRVHNSPERNTPEVVDDSQNDGNAVPEYRELNLITDISAAKDGNGAFSPVSGDKNDGILERKRGKTERSISLEVLQGYFTGSLKDAAKSLGVCPTTMKRICRQHGIARWPSRKIKKVNHSLSKLKRVIESVQGAEGAFDLTSISFPLPADSGSTTWPVDLVQIEAAPRGKDSSPEVTPESDDRRTKLPEIEEVDCSKAISSSEWSVYGFGHGSQLQEAHLVNPFEPLLGGMLIEDSGSSKDLANLYSVDESCQDEGGLPLTQKPSQPTATQERRAVTVKACYGEDIVRFRMRCDAGVVALNGEVARRLKLEVGTFNVKYMDDDRDWVLLACDGDLEECMEFSRLSGAHVIRLTVDDVVANLGSSWVSSVE